MYDSSFVSANTIQNCIQNVTSQPSVFIYVSPTTSTAPESSSFLADQQLEREKCSTAHHPITAPLLFFNSPIKAAKNGGHAHHHIGNRQSIGCIFPSKLLDLQSCDLISQEQFVGALEGTWDKQTQSLFVSATRNIIFISTKKNLCIVILFKAIKYYCVCSWLQSRLCLSLL